MKPRSLVALAFGGLVLAAAPALQSCKSNQSTKSQINDAGITSSLKTKYIGDPDVKAFDISVNTDEGVVYLTGRVDTQAQKDEAERLAWNTDGVKQVVNNIKVGNKTY